MTTHRRAWAGALCAGLLGAVLPLVVVTAPAQAAACQHETANPLDPAQCDDTTPPETVLTAVTPAPTASGWVRSSTVRFDFSGSFGTTGDADGIAFQCELFATVADPGDWKPCTSGQAYTGLAESGAVPYTFKVRAVDTADEAVTTCAAPPLCLSGPEVPDHDATPATAVFAVDTTAPNTFVTRTPHDGLRPDWPVALTRRPQLVLNSNEGGAGFRCTVNGTRQPCTGGPVSLSRLRSGPVTFSAQAVDRAGNADPVPATTTFFVPANLRPSAGAGWARVRRGDAFDGDVVRTRKVGAVLRLGHQRDVRELRVIAPAGPRLGKVQVRVGHSRWYTVDLAGKAAGQRTYLVRDQFAPKQSGAVTIRVLSVPRGGSVQLDALVARS